MSLPRMKSTMRTGTSVIERIAAAAIDHGDDRNCDAAETHDVRTDAERLHGRERHQDADRKHHDGNESTAYMQQEHDADERNDNAFFRKGPLQSLDRCGSNTRA